MVYGIEDRPPLARALVLALQHCLTMFGATVSVPLLLGPMMGMGPAEIAVLVSSVMVCSGVATFLQVTVGTRLPIIQGVSFSFLGTFFAIIAYVKAHPVEGVSQGALTMQYIAGAVLAGAVVETCVGFSGLVGLLRRALSPVVVGPVIMIIGLALFKHGAPKAGQSWAASLPTIIMVFLFSQVLSRRYRVFALFPILLAVLVAFGGCWALSAAGVIPPGHPARVDPGLAASSPWFRADPRDLVFPWGPPRFEAAFFFAILASYLASIVESFGDYHSCSYMSGGGDPTPRQISRGIGAEGLGCLATGLLGGFASTSYSENIGLIGLTRVGSRHVVYLASFLLVAIGLVARFGAFVAAIPGPVVGGLYCALFGLIAAVGIQQLARSDLSSGRNLMIAGFSLFMGLSVPAYFDGSMVGVYPPGGDEVLEAIRARLGGTVADIVKVIGGTGMAVTALIGLALDNLIPGTPEERGIRA
ncbi:MAG: purine/pyrimidine permease [Planctomycetes bacterium]|nr:purine/pyrimidine permease [Planctomycetota bacterium]